MNDDYKKLHNIYKKYQKKYKNPDSNQMCCMWSTRQPPDVLLITQQITDIENAFGIELTEDEAVNLYDMDIDVALIRIIELKNKIQHE